MQRFVGAGSNKLVKLIKNNIINFLKLIRDKMFVELSDVLFNEIRFVRTLYEGGPLKTRFIKLV